MTRPYNKIEFTKEWLDNYPKTINENGCWIPSNKADSKGYVRIMAEKSVFVLSRLSMCIIYNIDYNNKKIVTKHSKGCDTRCFWYEHLKPGTDLDNAKDAVRDKTNLNAKKEFCPKCQGEYKIRTVKTGWNRGQVSRYCPVCVAIKNSNRYH